MHILFVDEECIEKEFSLDITGALCMYSGFFLIKIDEGETRKEGILLRPVHENTLCALYDDVVAILKAVDDGVAQRKRELLNGGLFQILQHG